MHPTIHLFRRYTIRFEIQSSEKGYADLVKLVLDAPKDSALQNLAADRLHCGEYPRLKVEVSGRGALAVEAYVPAETTAEKLYVALATVLEKNGWSVRVMGE